MIAKKQKCANPKCEEMFIAPKNKRKQFHSLDCYERHRHLIMKEEKTCIMCGVKYKSSRQTKAACSRECYNQKRHKDILNKKKAFFYRHHESELKKRRDKKTEDRKYLKDPYIIDKIKRSGLILIPEQLISLKRIHMEINRTLKQLNP